MNEQEVGLIAQRARELARNTEEEYYQYIDEQAAENGVDAGELLARVRAFNKEWRFGQNRNKIRFYHATSMEALTRILNDGELLSRKERAARGEDLSALPWSSSENLQFTHDSFGPRGELRESGLGMGSGAAGSDLSFVFGGDLMDEPSFDATTIYPSVERVNLAEKCLGIIVRDVDNVEKVIGLLKERNIELPVYSARKYDARVSTQKLQETKMQMQNAQAEEIKEEPEEPAEQSQARGVELLREAEIQSVIKSLEALDPIVDRLTNLLKGSASTDESATVLKKSLQNMKEQSEEYLKILQNGRGLGEVLLHGNEFAKSVEEELGYATRALDVLKRKAEAFPMELSETITYDIQQVENNMRMAYGIVVRKKTIEV